MICKDWNKKKLTALVCAGIMAGMLFPCAWVEAKSAPKPVTFDDNDATVTDGEAFDKKLQWISRLYYPNVGIALSENATQLVIDFNGEKDKDFYGGCKDTDDTITGYAVTLKHGTVGSVYGACSYGKGTVTGNTVTISDGTVGYVYGGYCMGDVYTKSSGSATGNTVTISGGTVDYVYGGFSQYDKATGNTVNLIGKGGTLEGVVTNNPNVPKVRGITGGVF